MKNRGSLRGGPGEVVEGEKTLQTSLGGAGVKRKKDKTEERIVSVI